MKMIRTYSELIKFSTFEERYEYLRLNGSVGEVTFGSKRYLNQILYKTARWLRFRDSILIRDNGCDLGIEDREIIRPTIAIVHHINPITIDDVLENNPLVFDPDNMITVTDITHKAIHYSNRDLLLKDPIERFANDTCPWR